MLFMSWSVSKYRLEPTHLPTYINIYICIHINLCVCVYFPLIILFWGRHGKYWCVLILYRKHILNLQSRYWSKLDVFNKKETVVPSKTSLVSLSPCVWWNSDHNEKVRITEHSFLETQSEFILLYRNHFPEKKMARHHKENFYEKLIQCFSWSTGTFPLPLILKAGKGEAEKFHWARAVILHIYSGQSSLLVRKKPTCILVAISI